MGCRARDISAFEKRQALMTKQTENTRNIPASPPPQTTLLTDGLLKCRLQQVSVPEWFAAKNGSAVPLPGKRQCRVTASAVLQLVKQRCLCVQPLVKEQVLSDSGKGAGFMPEP